MNQTLQDLKTRRSCRRYRPEQIKESELEQILEAGVFAPTGMGMQSPKIVVVQDKETIEELSKMNAKIMGVTSDPFYGAPTVLIVLADKNRNTLSGRRFTCHGQSDECGTCRWRGVLLDPPCKRRV